MPTRRTAHLVPAPQQERSQATQDAIVRAFMALTETRTFEDIGVADIARKAKVSVGGFYARFRSKEALILPVLNRVTDEWRASLAVALDKVDARHGRMADVISAYVSQMMTGFRAHRAMLLQLGRAARGDASKEFGEVVHAFNLDVHERFRQACLARRDEIVRDDAPQAIEFALFFASASARDAVLGANWRSYSVNPTDAQVTAEITRAALRYLGVPEQPTPAKRRRAKG